MKIWFLVCCLLVAVSSQAFAKTAMNKAALTLQKSLEPMGKDFAKIWHDYLMIDQLASQEKIDVQTRDTIACRLEQTSNRPEYQAPITTLKGFAALERAVSEIKFTPAAIKAAGRGPGHAPVTCSPAKYTAPALKEKPIKLKKEQVAGQTPRIGTSPFSLFQIRYWPFHPDKSGECASPMAKANEKILTKATQDCRDLGYQQLLEILKNPPVECLAWHSKNGPKIFNMSVAEYKKSSASKSCRLTRSFRSIWTYRHTSERPTWEKNYDRGYIMWPVETFESASFLPNSLDKGLKSPDQSGCRIPTRFDLVRYCAEGLSLANNE